MEKVIPLDLHSLYENLQNNVECKSLIKKHLTKEIIKKYEHLKTKKGITLYDCVKHATNPETDTPRCFDVECWDLFSDFWDAVIRDYHKKTEIIHPPSDFGDLSNLPFEDLNQGNNLVVSTRARVGRSIRGFDMPSIITKECRLELEKKIVNALCSLKGDLEGTYFPCDGMSKEESKRLVDEHFLFTDDNTVMLDCGCYRDWPSGRGIFFNKKRNFLVWINEEDHIRIISMDKGGDLSVIYSRLVRAVHHLGTMLEFEHNDKLGFLTFCPTNLGTALRASVHAKIPLAASLPNFADICESLYVQPRGTDGEHSKNRGGIYDLSNKRRLGFTEIQGVTEMVNGVKEILMLEQDLQKQAETIKSPVESLPRLTKMIQDNKKSRFVGKKYLTGSMIAKLDGKMTSFGTTLAHCIRTCAYHPECEVGYVGDAECYKLFGELFNSVILSFNDLKSLPNMSTLLINEEASPINLNEKGKFVNSISISISRNLEGIAFPIMMNESDRLQLEAKVQQKLGGKYIPIAKMDKDLPDNLIFERSFINRNNILFRDAKGYQDWPVGRGIMLWNDLVIRVGEEDHLKITYTQHDGQLGVAFATASKLMQQLEGQLGRWSQTEELGFLTSSPENIGTGFHITARIVLPKIKASMSDFKTMGLQHGLDVKDDASNSNSFEVTNKYCYGVHEIGILKKFQHSIVELINLENAILY